MRPLPATSLKWIKAIKLSGGEHGSGILQKKLWRITSDCVRIRDYYQYGTCVATGAKLGHWMASQAGHFIAYSVCRGMFKWDTKNIHAQSASSNSWGGMEIGHSFGEELERRGYNLDDLRATNNATELKVNDTMVVEKMREILLMMKRLPEKPDYYARVISLL
jgi:hypothetical protein